MRVLITGAAGMLGRDVTSAAALAGHEVIALTREDLDIGDLQAVQAAVRRAAPGAVINCAAFTDVDGAESDPARALAVNGEAAGHVAAAAVAVGAWTLHVSSDYVFDGSKGAPYVESDATAPLSEYGRSKLVGEQLVARAAPHRHTIVRSSWLFGLGGKSFPKTIIRLAAERDELAVVDDQVGCPTFTGHLAPALVALACERQIAGIVHAAAAGRCSWYEFATAIVARADLRCEIKPGRTADLGRPAPRPAFSVLRSELGTGVTTLPDWHEGLTAYLAAGVPA